MSLHALSSSNSHLNARAGQHLHAVRHANAQVDIEARSQVKETETEQDSFVDVIARQLTSSSSSFQPVAKRSKAVPFGKRATDDDYEGPIDLEQDEFALRPTRVRRQAQQSPAPGGTLPPLGNSPQLWQNGDVGTVQALFADGTSKNLMVGDVVYATQGSEDGSAKGAIPLQAKIMTPDGGAIVPGTLFAMQDSLGVYTKVGAAKPYIGVSPSSNPGVPFWTGPMTNVANIWSIDTTTGELTATYQDSVLQWAINDNTTPYPNSIYTGNGDADAWPADGKIDSLHTPAALRLVRTS